MSSVSRYHVYRVIQPRVDENQGVFQFDESLSDEALRHLTIREAFELGRQSEAGWVAGSLAEQDNMISFIVGKEEAIEAYVREDGDIKIRSRKNLAAANVFIDLPTGIMLIQEAKDAPTPFLVATAFKKWLERANDLLASGFKPYVQKVPRWENLISELEKAEAITSVSFVVHGPNPSDDDDVLGGLVTFTGENQIQSTAVTLYARNISKALAKKLAIGNLKLGNKFSARIRERNSAKEKPVSSVKKARTVTGKDRPTIEDGIILIKKIKDDFERNREGRHETPE